MKYVRRVMAMFLSVVMVLGLMSGGGTPKVMAAYETDIIDVEFETIHNGETLWNSASWLNMLSNATAEYYIHDVVTWPSGQAPKKGGDYSYTRPTWTITPSDVVQIHGIDADYEQDAGNNYNSGITLSPLKKGTATLTWTTGKVTKTLTINVVDVLATAVRVSPQSVSLTQVGQQQQLAATVTPTAASQEVIWSTSNPAVATVDSKGVVTSVGTGVCEITATATGGNSALSYHATVNVILAGDASPVYLNGTYEDSMKLAKGESKYAPFDSFYSDFGCTIKSKASDFTYTSNNSAVATVDSTGKIAAVGVGSATISMDPINQSGMIPSGFITISVTVTEEASLTGVYSVSITPASASLKVGESQYLDVYVDADSGKESVKLSSSASNIASVRNLGGSYCIYANAPGTATITVTSSIDPTKYAECTVTVTEKIEVTGITLSKTATTLEAGVTETLTANVTANGDVDKTLSWTSNNTSVATVDSNGKITAVAPGTATITVTSKSNSQVKATCTVTVTAKKVFVTGVALQPNSISLDTRDNSKKTATLTATISPVDATDKSLIWTSSNVNVATVVNGVVTAVGAGTATITARANDGSNCSASCTVTVVTPVESITLSKTNLTLNKNGTVTITATVNPTGATNKTITAQSKNTDVATVSPNADGSYTIKGVGTGHTDIVFTAADNGRTASCVVTVNPTMVSSIILKGSDGVTVGDTLEMTIGDSSQLSAVVSPSDADNKNVIWESANTDVITVSPTGLLTAKGTGTAELRVIPQDGSNAKKTVAVKVNPKYVTGISVSAKDNKTTLKKGETLQLSAVITPADATDKNLIWSSSNENLATVRADGMVEVIADKMDNQTVIITATAQDGSHASGSIKLTVTPTPVESFTISQGNVGVGKTLQLQVMSFTPQTATNPKVVSWLSSNANIATVSDAGVVTGKVAGTVTITATCADGKTATSTVTVVSDVIEVTTFTVESSKSLTVGENCTITATVQPYNATNKTLTWTITEGQDVIVINDKTDTSAPVFAAKKPGTAKIEVKSASNPALLAQTVIVTVLPKYVTEIQITADKTGSIKQGGTVQLSAGIIPADATYQGVTWSSSNETLATVDAVSGKVEIKTTGSKTPTSVDITATAKDGLAGHTAVSKKYTIQIAAQDEATVMVSGVAINGESTRNVKTSEGVFTVTADVTPANATNKTLTWKIIEGEGVVGISAAGASCTVKPISAGTAKIQVSSVANPAASAILVVNVTADVQHTHTYTEAIIRQATCTETGEKKYTCKCGDVKTELIPALGHSYTDAIVAPTTDSQGYTRHTCNRCGSYYDDNYVPKLEQIPQEPTTEQPKDEKDMPKVGKSVDVSGGRYKVTKSSSKTKEVTYVKPKNSKKTSVTIPATIKINGYTYKVTAIADKAFKNNKKIKSVTIGKNVKKIGKEAFYNCKKLSKITITSAVLKTVGKNAIKNINKKATIKVPKKQLKKYKKLFKSKTGFKKTMKIKK